MNIAVIGAGTVGCTLGKAFRKAGYTVIFGVRDPEGSFKGREFCINEGFEWFETRQSADRSDVIVLCVPGEQAASVAATLGNVHDKIIIDTMNRTPKDNLSYSSTSEAVLANCNCHHFVKCFNTTGFENLADPVYGGRPIDMFVCGDSFLAKSTAIKMAKAIGFGKVWDVGGNDRFILMEQLAVFWIALAVRMGNGRHIAIAIDQRVLG